MTDRMDRIDARGGEGSPERTEQDGAALVDLRHAPGALRGRVLALNARHEVETAPLDAARLDRLIALSCSATARADGQAFLLACDADAPHDGARFAWFRARLDAFVYVDRIVVAPALRGTGLARRLYGMVIAHAAARGWPVVCEVNADPPNPRSAAFHARLGFEEMACEAADRGKTVSYLIRR